MVKRTLILALLLSLLMGACSFPTQQQPTPLPTVIQVLGATPTPEPTATEAPPTPTASPTVTATSLPTATPTPAYPPEGLGPDNFPENVNPLTGLEVEDISLLERRPVSVKVNIIPRQGTRPPWGLSFADIVYEFYQNAGYTRFHAVFLGQDSPLVGPIRSARMLDGPLVRMHSSIFAYSGADGNVDITLRNSVFGYRLARDRAPRTTCPPTDVQPMCRFDPTGYDFLMTGTAEVHVYMRNRGVDDERQNLDGMFFKLEPPEGGELAEVVYTRHSLDSYNRWDYDAETGRYLRYQDTVVLRGDQQEEYLPLMDRVNDQQIVADNVVILLAPHEYFRPPPGEIIEVELKDKGQAYAFRDGRVYPVIWRHSNPDQVMYLTYEDGTLFPFKPGITWFQIVGKYSEISQPDETTWRFRSLWP